MKLKSFMKNSSYYFNKFRAIISLLGGVFLLCSCEGLQEKRLTQTQKDSVLASMLTNYSQIHQEQLKKTEKNFSNINLQLATQKTKDLVFTKKAPVRFPTCSGNFRDSCFFQSSHMALLVSKEQLAQARLKSDLHTLINVDGNGLINTFWAVRDQSYRPIMANFQDTPFSSVEKQMYSDLYNVQLFFGLKYLFVLEVSLYSPPIDEYGGGRLKGYYHVFDFQQAAYLGSIAVSAENTADFQPPTQTTKEVTKIEERTRYDGKRIITDRYKTKNQEKQDLSPNAQYYYANQNLIRNFKESTKKLLNESFCNEKGDDIYLY